VQVTFGADSGSGGNGVAVVLPAAGDGAAVSRCRYGHLSSLTPRLRLLFLANIVFIVVLSLTLVSVPVNRVSCLCLRLVGHITVIVHCSLHCRAMLYVTLMMWTFVYDCVFAIIECGAFQLLV
jgi:hypothetical protein